MVGGELFTGNNLVMAFGAYDKSVTWKQAGKVWLVSYIGNFIGCLIFALIFVGAGASGTADYYAGFIGNKLSIPIGQMFFRAVLCNFFVCLGVLCGIKLKSEAAKILMITLCISGFVVSGFEHCIANMGNFVTAYLLVDGLSLGAMLRSMVVVTLGNMVGGAILLAWPLRKMSADK
jgi:nitrite transporter NirC